MRTRIKICGITSVEDALLAARAGADAIGLQFYEKSKRVIDIEEARTIVAALPPFVTSVALFVDPEASRVREVLQAMPISVLQFHGEESADFCAQFRRPFLKAVRMRPGVDLLQYALRYPDAQALLLDAYREGAAGGTGDCFDWSLIPPVLPLPIVLAGGLRPENVASAVRQVKPWAVDVASGVEASPRRKDAQMMQAFVQGVRDADV